MSSKWLRRVTVASVVFHDRAGVVEYILAAMRIVFVVVVVETGSEKL